MSHVIIVEGGIGSGKSTLCEKLGKALNYRVMYEPVKENPYLEKFYQDMDRWGLEMQYFMLSARYEMHQQAIEHCWRTGQPVIMDRSYYGDAVFCERLYLDGHIDRLGYDCYLKMRDVMSRSLLVPQLTIYLKTKPEKCLERIAMRGRDCEKGIPLTYLAGLDELYGKLMREMASKGSRVVELDWDQFMATGDVIQHLENVGALAPTFSAYPEIKKL